MYRYSMHNKKRNFFTFLFIAVTRIHLHLRALWLQSLLGHNKQKIKILKKFQKPLSSSLLLVYIVVHTRSVCARVWFTQIAIDTTLPKLSHIYTFNIYFFTFRYLPISEIHNGTSIYSNIYIEIYRKGTFSSVCVEPFRYSTIDS